MTMYRSLPDILLLLCIVFYKGRSVNVLGSVGLAAPLQCSICEHSDTSGDAFDHYTNITVYSKPGDVILGGLFPLQEIDKTRGHIRTRNVALAEVMAWTIDRINEDPDVLPGVTLGYEIRDSFSNAPMASVQALELAARNVFGVVGPGSSKVAVHLASLLGSLSFPMITYAATSDILSDQNRFRYFARTVPSDEFQVQALTDLIHHYDWTFVSVLHSPELYGSEGASELKRRLESKGIYIDRYQSLLQSLSTKVLLDETIKQTLHKNATSINRYPATVIVLFATKDYARAVIESAVRLQKQPQNKDMFKRVTWIASESWGSEPSIIKHFNLSDIGNFIGLKIKTFPIYDFIDYYRSLTPDNSSNPWFSYYYTEEYCGGSEKNCSATVYEQGPYEEPVLLAVESFAHTLHNMLFPRNDTDELDQCVTAADPITNTEGAGDLYYLRNSPLGSCLYNKLITGAIPVHMVEVVKSLFKGEFRTRVRDEVRFDSSTGDFEAMYSILTLLSDNVRQYVDHEDPITAALHDYGVWNKSGIYLDEPFLPFKNFNKPESLCSLDCPMGMKKVPDELPTCWSCVACDDQSITNKTNQLVCTTCGAGFRAIKNNTECEAIPPTFLAIGHPAAIILIIVGIIGILLTTGTIIVFVKFRDTPLVKASSKELCMVLLAGLLVGFLSSFLSIGLPTDSLCLMQLVSGNLFGTMTIVPIFLKTARVYALFFQSKSSAGRPPRYLLPMWQSMLCMVLVLIQMVILMFVIIFYPLKEKTDYSISGSVLVVCSGATERDTIIALSAPVGYVMCFVVLSTILSYQVRKLPSNFQEARYICFAQIIALIVLIAFVPSYFVTAGIWQKFCIGIATQIIAFAFLILVFSKKVEIIVLYPERNKIVFEKDKINRLDMSRKERRRSFLTSQNCHMCGQALRPKPSAGAGLMAAASLVTGVNDKSQGNGKVSAANSLSLGKSEKEPLTELSTVSKT